MKVLGDLEMLWGLNYHQNKGVLTEIHKLLANKIISKIRIMNTFGQIEVGGVRKSQA